MDDFLVRAFVAGAGVALAAGPLGSFIVWGRMAYFGEALAHSALLGVAIGLAIGADPTSPVIFVAGLVGVALALLQGGRGIAGDTMLGIFAQSTLALGLVVLSFLRTVRVDLLGYLFGDVLAVTPGDIGRIWIAALVSLAVLAAIWRPLLSLTIHEELARVEGVAVARVRNRLHVAGGGDRRFRDEDRRLAADDGASDHSRGGGAAIRPHARADGGIGRRHRLYSGRLRTLELGDLGYAVGTVDRGRGDGDLRSIAPRFRLQARAAALSRSNPASRSAIRSSGSSSPA